MRNPDQPNANPSDPDFAAIRRLAVVFPTLGGGGVERMRMHLIHDWVMRGIAVDLVLRSAEGPLQPLVPKEVRIFEAGRYGSLSFPIGLYHYIRERRPSHILATPADIAALCLAFRRLTSPRIPVVVSIHNHLSSQIQIARGVRHYKARLAVKFFATQIQHARAVITVSQGIADDLDAHFPNLTFQPKVIYNPVITDQTQALIQAPVPDIGVPQGAPFILFVGRFVAAKGIDILIRAFQEIAGRTNAHLVLIGEGPLRNEIESHIRENCFANRIHLPGFQSNPLPLMRAAIVVVLPSRHEGLGNVLIEAMACGTQIIASDCPSGPAEILANGRFGQLVRPEDPAALASALLRSLNGEKMCSSTELQARANEFSVGRASRAYLKALVGHRKRPVASNTIG